MLWRQNTMVENEEMIVALRKRWRQSKLKRFLCCGAILSFASVTATAQHQTEQLQQQLEQLKQEYEKTTHDLEQRIAALQQQIDKEKLDREQQADKAKAESAKKSRRRSRPRSWLRSKRGRQFSSPIRPGESSRARLLRNHRMTSWRKQMRGLKSCSSEKGFLSFTA